MRYALMLCGLLVSAPLSAAGDLPITMHGTLVADPCSLLPGDENIAFDFNDVIEKYLYSYQRTPGKRVTVHLVGCDIALGSSVEISFSGSEDTQQPGLLALADGGAAGIAIGFETPDGSALRLNSDSANFTLADGENSLAVLAYIQASPEAIKNHTILPGAFSAAVTFTLVYP